MSSDTIVKVIVRKRSESEEDRGLLKADENDGL